MCPDMILPRSNKPVVHGPVDEAIRVTAYKAVSAVAELVKNTVDAVRIWRQRRAAIAELSRLNDRLLKDIGIDRNEIRAVVNGMVSRPSARTYRPALHVAAAADPARPAADNDNEYTDAARRHRSPRAFLPRSLPPPTPRRRTSAPRSAGRFFPSRARVCA